MFDYVNAIRDFLETGGVVLYGILAVSVLMWTLIIERYWYIKLVFPKEYKTWLDEWDLRKDRSSWRAKKIRESVIAEANARLRNMVQVIKTLIAICPMFGLLGTVTGMIVVFDTMALIGTSNPRVMASGISLATVPTMAGMVIALTGLYFGQRFDRLAAVNTQRLADAMLEHFNPSVKIEPEYPEEAKAKGVEGYVELEFTITEKGLVIDPQILSAEPAGVFDAAAVRAIQKWKFEPRVVDGEKIAHQAIERLDFKLK